MQFRGISKMKMNPDTQPFGVRGTRAYTLAEVMISIFILSVMVISLYAGFYSGFSIVKLSRENLRATQILVQKMEDIRILTWSQITTSKSSYLKSTFVDYYNPSGTNNNTYGAYYNGTVSIAAPANIPAAYSANMKSITVTVYWTNSLANPSTNVIVRSRQMQTLVARYGMQDYIYK
jgi:Tfp pilus assembly protein PilV